MYPHSALRPQRLPQPGGLGGRGGGGGEKIGGGGKEHPPRRILGAGVSVAYKIPIALYPVRDGFTVHLSAVRFPQSAVCRSRERRYA